MRANWPAVLLLSLCGCAGAPDRAPDAGSGLVAGAPVPAWPAPARADCPMTRALDGRPICVPDPRAARPPDTGNRPTTRVSAPRDYVVIGSFANRDNAERWARRNAEFGTSVRRTHAGGSPSPLYRVVVGPLGADDSTRLVREILTTIGLDGSWSIALCAGTGPSCERGEGLDEARFATLAATTEL